MLVCFASEKGGAGKTTLAACLAEVLTKTGVPVRLVDGDRQGSLLAVAERSQGRIPDARAAFPTQFTRVARSEGLTFLDLPSGIGVEFHTAMALADAAIVPVVPSAFDLRTLPATLGRIRKAQDERDGLPRTLIVPNKINLRETMSKELLSITGKLGWPVTRVWLQERAAFRQMGNAGLGALPSSSRRPAELEVAALADEIVEFLGVQREAEAA